MKRETVQDTVCYVTLLFVVVLIIAITIGYGVHLQREADIRERNVAQCVDDGNQEYECRAMLRGH